MNYVIEARKNAYELRNRLAEEAEKSINESIKAREDFSNQCRSIVEKRKEKEARHGKLLESARNNTLSTALKAIYITALGEYTLTDEGIILAESMVDSWINEKGGANAIFNKCENNSYLLARLSQIVNEVAEEEVEEIEKEDEEDSTEDTTEKESESKEDDATTESEKKEDKEEDDNEESEKKEDSDDNSDEDSSKDDAISIDGAEKNQGKVFDELEKEEDVQKAIELIRQRVADAEETFIKRNAEDKKQIDELLGKISDNIKTIEDMDDKESTESKIAEESAMYLKRSINEITENKPQTIFEKMTRNLATSITKDKVLREQYLNENNTIDFGSVIESAKVMYGFLETLNTLQLEKVDEKYINSVLEEI